MSQPKLQLPLQSQLQPATVHPTLPRLPGIDGLRAVAVLAVVLYHAELAWMPGGFLGVEVFFVISGYLITGLLLSEWCATGRLNLLRFWLRRARRLLPALFMLLLGVMAFTVLFLPDEVAALRGDVLAAALYVSNWHQVFSNRPYFEIMGRPPLLQHLWSLAVEEQFYLLWPVLFVAGLRRLRSPRAFALLVIGFAALSTLLMAALAQPDADPSRVYYGTDTRAAGFLVGSALVLLWPPTGRAPGRPSRLSRWAALLIDGVGLCALIALGSCFVWLSEIHPMLYQGGFALVALLTAVTIAATVYPGARLLLWLLDGRALHWVGQRSYSIYLWHWPVIVLTRPQLDVAFDGIALWIIRLGLTAVLAELSYRYVEQPIRNGGVGRALDRLRAAQGGRRWRLGLLWASTGAVAVALVSALGVAAATARAPLTPAEYAESGDSADALAVQAVTVVVVAPSTSAKAQTDVTPAPVVTATSSATLSATVSVTTAVTVSDTAQATAQPAAVAMPTPQVSASLTATQAISISPAVAFSQVTAIGDSVMRGAAMDMKRLFGNIEVDAVVSRQAGAAIRLLRARRDARRLGDVVIVHIGNNGFFTAKQFDEMMQVLNAVPRVLVINVRVPRRWEGPNNTTLADGVKRYPNAVLVDWYAASTGHPEWFTKDGIHLRPDGRRLYSELLAAQLGAKSIGSHLQ